VKEVIAMAATILLFSLFQISRLGRVSWAMCKEEEAGEVVKEGRMAGGGVDGNCFSLMMAVIVELEFFLWHFLPQFEYHSVE